MRFGLLAVLALAVALASDLRAQSASEIFELAFERYKQKDYETALLLYEEGFRQDPSNGEANYYVGKLKMEWILNSHGNEKKRNQMLLKLGGTVALMRHFNTSYKNSKDGTIKTLALEEKLKLTANIEKRGWILNNKDEAYFGYWYEYDSTYPDAVFCFYFWPALKFRNSDFAFDIASVDLEKTKLFWGSADRSDPKKRRGIDRVKISDLYWILWSSVLYIETGEGYGYRFPFDGPYRDYARDYEGTRCGTK